MYYSYFFLNFCIFSLSSFGFVYPLLLQITRQYYCPLQRFIEATLAADADSSSRFIYFTSRFEVFLVADSDYRISCISKKITRR